MYNVQRRKRKHQTFCLKLLGVSEISTALRQPHEQDNNISIGKFLLEENIGNLQENKVLHKMWKRQNKKIQHQK